MSWNPQSASSAERLTGPQIIYTSLLVEPASFATSSESTAEGTADLRSTLSHGSSSAALRTCSPQPSSTTTTLNIQQSRNHPNRSNTAFFQSSSSTGSAVPKSKHNKSNAGAYTHHGVAGQALVLEPAGQALVLEPTGQALVLEPAGQALVLEPGGHLPPPTSLSPASSNISACKMSDGTDYTHYLQQALNYYRSVLDMSTEWWDYLDLQGGQHHGFSADKILSWYDSGWFSGSILVRCTRNQVQPLLQLDSMTRGALWIPLKKLIRRLRSHVESPCVVDYHATREIQQELLLNHDVDKEQMKADEAEVVLDVRGAALNDKNVMSPAVEKRTALKVSNSLLVLRDRSPPPHQVAPTGTTMKQAPHQVAPTGTTMKQAPRQAPTDPATMTKIASTLPPPPHIATGTTHRHDTKVSQSSYLSYSTAFFSQQEQSGGHNGSQQLLQEQSGGHNGSQQLLQEQSGGHNGSQQLLQEQSGGHNGSQQLLQEKFTEPPPLQQQQQQQQQEKRSGSMQHIVQQHKEYKPWMGHSSDSSGGTALQPDEIPLFKSGMWMDG
ncbi:hypothetical protein CEUSTIGMA_g8876.t1, partial [Chlamydomonas eustigma]